MRSSRAGSRPAMGRMAHLAVRAAEAARDRRCWISPDELASLTRLPGSLTPAGLAAWLVDEPVAVTADDGMFRPTARAITPGGCLKPA